VTFSIFDTTLRDGDQAPGCAFTVSQKITLARLLDAVGVDVIEAGFPASSSADFEACRLISAEGLRARIAAMSRSRPDDVARTAAVFSAMRAPEKSILHLSLPVSDAHIAAKLGKSRADIIRMAEGSVRYARGFAAAVEMGAEDATRADRDFLADYCAAVIAAGAGVVNIADTVGISRPSSIADLVRFLVVRVPAFADGRAVLSVHCHNDLGLATANTLAAIEAGASQAEVTVAGIGERAGNASLEELAANLLMPPVVSLAGDSLPLSRGDLLPSLSSDFDLSRIGELSRVVSAMLGSDLSPFRPLFGRNVHAHASGIHQDGVLADPALYNPVGTMVSARSAVRGASARDSSSQRPGSGIERIVLGRHSGRAGLAFSVRRYAGLDLPEDAIADLLAGVKDEGADQPLVGITELLDLLFSRGALRERPLKCLFIEESVTDAGCSISARIGENGNGVTGFGGGWMEAALSLGEKIKPVGIRLVSFSLSSCGGAATSSVARCRLFVDAELESAPSSRYAIERIGGNPTRLAVEIFLDIINAESALARSAMPLSAAIS
jgi:2-isopropylmalate synthase